MTTTEQHEAEPDSGLGIKEMSPQGLAIEFAILALQNGLIRTNNAEEERKLMQEIRVIEDSIEAGRMAVGSVGITL